MTFHVIFPDEGHRLLYRESGKALGLVSDMLSATKGERTVVIARADITRSELIADLKDAIEYAKKDLP